MSDIKKALRFAAAAGIDVASRGPAAAAVHAQRRKTHNAVTQLLNQRQKEKDACQKALLTLHERTTNLQKQLDVAIGYGWGETWGLNPEKLAGQDGSTASNSEAEAARAGEVESHLERRREAERAKAAAPVATDRAARGDAGFGDWDGMVFARGTGDHDRHEYNESVIKSRAAAAELAAGKPDQLGYWGASDADWDEVLGPEAELAAGKPDQPGYWSSEEGEAQLAAELGPEAELAAGSEEGEEELDGQDNFLKRWSTGQMGGNLKSKRRKGNKTKKKKKKRKSKSNKTKKFKYKKSIKNKVSKFSKNKRKNK
jgi:hypothetical protein